MLPLALGRPVCMWACAVCVCVCVHPRAYLSVSVSGSGKDPFEGCSLLCFPRIHGRPWGWEGGRSGVPLSFFPEKLGWGGRVPSSTPPRASGGAFPASRVFLLLCLLAFAVTKAKRRLAMWYTLHL